MPLLSPPHGPERGSPGPKSVGKRGMRRWEVGRTGRTLLGQSDLCVSKGSWARWGRFIHQHPHFADEQTEARDHLQAEGGLAGWGGVSGPLQSPASLIRGCVAWSTHSCVPCWLMVPPVSAVPLGTVLSFGCIPPQSHHCIKVKNLF